MKKRSLVIIALVLMMVVSLGSCSMPEWLGQLIVPYAPAVELTDAALETEKIIDFANGADRSVLFESDGWSNGDVFNVVWRDHNVYYENGIMRLGITEEKDSAWLNDAEVEFNYTAGEARTQNYYGYGDYEVSMKPSANPGTASTFFICTGPYDLKDGEPNPHDEIDIEFLGKDTTHVQFNFFVNGKGGNEYMYDLGFDASKEFHTYGFRWTENSITWFVDGEPVYKVTTDKSVTAASNLRVVDVLPSTAGRILSNYWCGNERAWGWMGRYSGETKDNGTQYQWIATSAEGAPLNPPVEPPVGGDDTEINWAEIDPIAPEFPDAAPYDVTVEGNKATVAYTDVSGSAYMPIELDVTDAVAGKNYVSMKVTNNGTETVNVRVNMFDPTLTGNNKATNISATMNGEGVRTDLEWGGSFFDIPAGETAELVVHFGVGGVKLQLMIDSSRNDTTLRSGNITVEDIKFAAVGEVEAPHKCEDLDEDGKCDGCGEDMPTTPPPAPADPESGDLTVVIGGTEVQLGGNITDGYGVHANDEDGTIKVVYTNITTNTYENIWAAIATIAEGKTQVSLKIKNNGTETAYITVKLETSSAAALMEGKMEIPAGEEHEFTHSFSGAADKLYFFIDSGWSNATTTHAGEVVISDIAFSGEATEEPDPDPTPDTGLQLNFWTSSNDYTVNGNNIKYNGAGNSYSCAGSADIATHAAGKNTFTVTITNNGTAASRVRIDIQGTNTVGNHAVLNTGATGGDVWTDAEWGGSTVTVAAGESVTLVITYDIYTDRGAVTNLVVFVDSGRGDAETYNSDVTLSGMAFSGEAVAPHTCMCPCADCGKCTDADCLDAACAEKCEGHATVEMKTLAITFGSNGNYKTPVDMVDLTNVYIGDNGGDNAQVKQGYILVHLPAGSKLTINGYPNYTVYNIDGGELITDTTYVYTAEEAVTIRINADPEAQGKNYFYSLVIEYPKADAPVDPDPVEPVEMETLEITFGSNGNYKTPVDMVDLTNVYIGDNGGNNAQVKQGYITVYLPAGSKLTINGYPSYTAYNINGGSLITDTTYVYTAEEAETVRINADPEAQGHNYFYSLVIEYPKTEEPAPELPEVPTDGGYVKFEGNLEAYTVITESEYANVIQVTYSEISDNTYKNINTWIKDKADGNNTFSITIRNNGTATVYITVKLETADAVQVTENKMEIPAGQLGTLTTEYSGEAAKLFLFIDSGWSETTATHAGDITIAGIKFTLTEDPAPVIPTGEYLKYTGNDCYTLHSEQEYTNSIGVTYSAVSDNSYQNVNTWIQDKAAGKTTLSLYITNNGTETVNITVKLENGAGGAAEVKATIEAGKTAEVTLAYDFAPDLLYFFIDSGWSETTASHAGDITIAGVEFK